MFNIKNLFNRDNNFNKDNNIVYENGIVKSEILSWCKNLGINNIRDLLVKLGFNNSDRIYLYQDYGNLYRVIYSVGEDKINNNNFIWFNHKKNEIVVNNGNDSKCYNIDLYDDRVINLDLIYCKKKIDENVSCYSRLSNNNILFIIDNGDYELTLEINTYARISSDEIDDLEIYLTCLEFPIMIDRVYEDICYILSLEQDIMEMFNLVVTKNICKKKTDFVMDEILIQKGKLERITKTNDDKRITLDKDGNWIYDKIDDNSLLTVKYDVKNEPKYSYKNRSNDKNGYFSEESLSLLKKDANNKVDNVKKLVKKNFNNYE